MPVRGPAPGADGREYWRTYVFGDLATLITLETRHTARSRQISYPEPETFRSREDRDRFMREVIGDPSRKMLSEAMERHLRAGLTASVRAGQPWRVIGNASPMARNLLPNFVELGLAPEDFPENAKSWLWLGQWNLPWYTDTWDGYPAAREAFYRLAREAGASDLLVLTGDSHSFWANELHDSEGRPMGVELGTAGISSPSDLIDSGFDRAIIPRIDEALRLGMDEVHWVNSVYPGYVRVVLGRHEAVATFIGVDNVLSPEYQVIEIREERISPSGDSLAWG
jgi:alkaline phosphatase D